MNRYGFEAAKWEEAKNEARAILIERAKVRGLISYSDLMYQITSIKMDPHDVRISPFLEEISLAEHSGGRPLITAIVTHKTGDMQPGHGFYELAKKLGKDITDLTKCWVEEFKKVHSYWEKKGCD
ncbi:hypothetical protein EG832_15975 [bacterium]|nr:hypothetical protein [bacterium]